MGSPLCWVKSYRVWGEAILCFFFHFFNSFPQLSAFFLCFNLLEGKIEHYRNKTKKILKFIYKYRNL